MTKKSFITTCLIVLTCCLLVAKSSVLAAPLGLSKGIMPGNPLYSLKLNIEQIQLYTVNNNPHQQASLYLQFGNKRLNELDYLTDQENIELKHVVTVTAEYQKNIDQFSKIITNQQASVENINQISPKITELQVKQNQVVDKINQKDANEETKIIVKTTIKESQDNLIEAVVTAKKPIEEQVKSDNNQIASEQKTPESEKNIALVKKLDATIQTLNETKEELKKEIIQDEATLKQKKEDNDTQIEQDSKPKDITNVNLDLANSNPDNISDSLINETKTANGSNVNTTLSDKVEEVKVIKIDEVDNQIQPEVIESGKTTIDTNQLEPSVKVWYYSPTCDYVSDKPGKDPVCGEEMIDVSKLSADNSFYQKYTFKDGKYVQNINDLEDKKDQKLASEVQKSQDATNAVVPSPVPTPVVSPDVSI